MTAPTLGRTTAGPLLIHVEHLLETRALLTASWGWGKSWALRRLLEQTHGRGAIQIVIDPEGEFASLREKFDFVIAGKGGDCPADPRAADLLARKVLELGMSSVLDLYELPSHDRVRFVRRFLEALIDAPKALWRPALVVIDEAHMFAPESGQAESRDAVRGLMTRGRTRGFAGLLFHASHRWIAPIKRPARRAAADRHRRGAGAGLSKKSFGGSYRFFIGFECHYCSVSCPRRNWATSFLADGSLR